MSNREVAYGAGNLCSVALAVAAEPTCFVREETSWRANPQVAPDGRRVLYSSYDGRQHHQLWLTTLAGDAPLPLTFGEFDRTQARWSPDGRRIAYISNEGGNVSLWVQEFVGGKRMQIVPRERRHRARDARARARDHVMRRQARSRARECARHRRRVTILQPAPGRMQTTASTPHANRAKPFTSTAATGVRPIRPERVGWRRRLFDGSPRGRRAHHRLARPRASSRRESRAREKRDRCERDASSLTLPDLGAASAHGRPARAHELRRPLP